MLEAFLASHIDFAFEQVRDPTEAHRLFLVGEHGFELTGRRVWKQRNKTGPKSTAHRGPMVQL